MQKTQEERDALRAELAESLATFNATLKKIGEAGYDANVAGIQVPPIEDPEAEGYVEGAVNHAMFRVIARVTTVTEL